MTLDNLLTDVLQYVRQWRPNVLDIGAKIDLGQDSLAAALVKHSRIMAAPPFVAARVTPEMKTLLRVLAEREQITESALVRQLLEVMLRMSVKEGFPKLETLENVSRDARLSVRLAPEDRILLSDRATARGMPSATYVSVLVRSHLRNLAPLPKEELLSLKRSVAELGAIARNLNQIVRAANQGGKPAGPGREDLKAMLRVAEGLRDHVKALLSANQLSWEQGHAETRH
jgi:predicted DNA binding CopG/RHH family protein